MINAYISYMNVSSSIICTCTLVMVLAILHAWWFLYVKHVLQYVNMHAALFGANVTTLIECRSPNDFFLICKCRNWGLHGGYMKNNGSPSYQIFTILFKQYGTALTLVLKYTISCVSLFTGKNWNIEDNDINQKQPIPI